MNTATNKESSQMPDKIASRKKFFAGDRISFFKAFWKTEPFKKETLSRKLEESEASSCGSIQQN